MTLSEARAVACDADGLPHTGATCPMGAWTDEAVVFEFQGQRLVGVFSRPREPQRLGVLMLVGGPQYRAGSHRQMIDVARDLSGAGLPVFRFDYRGMGDSEGDPLKVFLHIGPDIGAAIDAMQTAMPQLEHVVLWGLCGGASASLLYVDQTRDPRVAGLALLNPWLQDESVEALTIVKHYYGQRLREGAFWRKLFSGGVSLSAVSDLLRNLMKAFARGKTAPQPTLPYQQRMARGWAGFDKPVLLMLSENDYTARSFQEYSKADPAWQQALRERPAQQLDLPGADHTCSQPEAAALVHRSTRDWIDRHVRRA